MWYKWWHSKQALIWMVCNGAAMVTCKQELSVMRKQCTVIPSQVIKTNRSTSLLEFWVNEEQIIMYTYMSELHIYIYICIYIYMYNDLTVTSLEWWLVRAIITKWPYFIYFEWCILVWLLHCKLTKNWSDFEPNPASSHLNTYFLYVFESFWLVEGGTVVFSGPRCVGTGRWQPIQASKRGEASVHSHDGISDAFRSVSWRKTWRLGGKGRA